MKTGLAAEENDKGRLDGLSFEAIAHPSKVEARRIIGKYKKAAVS